MKSSAKDPLENLQREVERLFHDLVYHRHPAAHFSEPRWAPSCDLVVEQGSARVLVELAGVPRESVRVRLHGRSLEISGVRPAPREPEGAHYHRAEIYFGTFLRVVELPWAADDGRVEAFYRDGMLEVHLRPAPVPSPADVTIEEHRA